MPAQAHKLSHSLTHTCAHVPQHHWHHVEGCFVALVCVCPSLGTAGYCSLLTALHAPVHCSDLGWLSLPERCCLLAGHNKMAPFQRAASPLSIGAVLIVENEDAVGFYIYFIFFTKPILSLLYVKKCLNNRSLHSQCIKGEGRGVFILRFTLKSFLKCAWSPVEQLDFQRCISHPPTLHHSV